MCKKGEEEFRELLLKGAFVSGSNQTKVRILDMAEDRKMVRNYIVKNIRNQDRFTVICKNMINYSLRSWHYTSWFRN